MLNNLKENEIQVATKLIFDGLSMAKASMEMILQSPIALKKIDFGNQEEEMVPAYTTLGEAETHTIKTELKGQLKGSCYLIFSQDDVEKITKACLPPSILNEDTPENKMMKMGFLTEIDNMVAAAVITEFSNFLSLEIFGDVPSLHIIKANEIDNYLDSESSTYDSRLHFKAIFHGKELDISPDFIWVINEKFLEKIKERV